MPRSVNEVPFQASNVITPSRAKATNQLSLTSSLSKSRGTQIRVILTMRTSSVVEFFFRRESGRGRRTLSTKQLEKLSDHLLDTENADCLQTIDNTIFVSAAAFLHLLRDGGDADLSSELHRLRIDLKSAHMKPDSGLGVLQRHLFDGGFLTLLIDLLRRWALDETMAGNARAALQLLECPPLLKEVLGPGRMWEESCVVFPDRRGLTDMLLTICAPQPHLRSATLSLLCAMHNSETPSFAWDQVEPCVFPLRHLICLLLSTDRLRAIPSSSLSDAFLFEWTALIRLLRATTAALRTPSARDLAMPPLRAIATLLECREFREAGGVVRLSEEAALGQAVQAGLTYLSEKDPLEIIIVQLLETLERAPPFFRFSLFSTKELLQMLRLLTPKVVPESVDRVRQVQMLWRSLYERLENIEMVDFDWLDLEGKKIDGKGREEEEEDGVIVLLLLRLEREEGPLMEVARRFERSVRERPLELALVRKKGLLRNFSKSSEEIN